MISRGPDTHRGIRTSESDAFLVCMCSAYGMQLESVRSIFYSDPTFAVHNKRVLTDTRGTLFSCLTVIPAKIELPIGCVPVVGIAGVATRPEYRGRGYASTLLSLTTEMAANTYGAPIALLYAEQPSLYLRNNWVPITRRTVQAVVRGRATPLVGQDNGDPHQCLIANLSDEPKRLKDVATYYRGRSKQKLGSFTRDQARWALIAGFIPNRRLVLCYTHMEELAGYAIVDTGIDGNTLPSVLEIDFSDDESFRCLNAFVARSFPRIVKAAINDSREHAFTTVGQVQNGGILMAQITDVALALEWLSKCARSMTTSTPLELTVVTANGTVYTRRMGDASAKRSTVLNLSQTEFAELLFASRPRRSDEPLEPDELERAEFDWFKRFSIPMSPVDAF